MAGVLHGGDFSYYEYQALMLLLAATMCVGLVGVEFTMRRFQVLPLLFPGMFCIRERRLYFFDFNIDDMAVGRRLRSEARRLVRVTLLVVLSYLWQRLVLETTQQVGWEFPSKQCAEGMDCFAAKIHATTFVNWKYEPGICLRDGKDFEERVVVSCVKFVAPEATNWLMHFAIAHSVTQLNFKCYEVLVWVAGNSRCIRRIMFLLIFAVLALLLWFLFDTSVPWLGFVTGLSGPVFFYTVWSTGRLYRDVWEAEANKVQASIAQHLKLALKDFQPEEEASNDPVDAGYWEARKVTLRAQLNSSVAMGRNLLNRSGLTHILPSRGAKTDEKPPHLAETRFCGDGVSDDSPRDGQDGPV